MASPTKPSDHLVSCDNDICKALAASETTLDSLTGKLFQLRIVDRPTKIAVMSKGGYKGADTLLDHVEMRVDNNPEVLITVFEAMRENTALKDITEQLERKTNQISTGIYKYIIIITTYSYQQITKPNPYSSYWSS